MMQALRQLGIGVVIALVSVILVVGGIFLSLAESLPEPATPTQIPPTFPLSFSTPTATITALTQSPTQAETGTASPSATTVLASSTVIPCSPPSGWIRINVSAGDTIYVIAQRYKTSAESLSAANCLPTFELSAGIGLYVPPIPTVTVIPCGPPSTWARAHVVQRGDNLYRIALSYGITYPQLQRANCMGNSTTIYTGQRLWVPNVATRTPVPGVTVIPDFPTQTLAPATNTVVGPSNTPTDPPTVAPTATQTSVPIPTDTPPSPVASTSP